MKQYFCLFVFSILLLLVSCQKKAVPDFQYDFTSISDDIITLSDDKMEGREIGTKGEKLAGDFIASRFSKIGLIPAGDNGSYFQTFTRKKNLNPHGEESEIGVQVEGRNVIGMIDNGADQSIIIGGHYDHLGYGAEGSLYSGEPAIHNGADDNSSGVAGVLSLAQNLKKKHSKKYNYIFICFSGEEKGLWGSNYYVKKVEPNAIQCMINMDMIGRLNGERKLAISGVGTTPEWKKTLESSNQTKLSLKLEESGMGPSDHASFYNAGIPVLAFFTGQHGDYHKPSDDAHLINYKGVEDIVHYIYNVVDKVDDMPKLPFVKTKDETKERMNFSVTLGVMPDYLFDGKGMKIDGVKDGKPAALAGMQKGDIVVKMGDIQVIDMQSYMKCLSHFKPGDKVSVIVLRDGNEMTKDVQF
ncbi:MAG: M20/M25/M40 family metallo-hydrolase [Saprospiraceae bacterium]